MYFNEGKSSTVTVGYDVGVTNIVFYRASIGCFYHIAFNTNNFLDLKSTVAIYLFYLLKTKVLPLICLLLLEEYKG